MKKTLLILSISCIIFLGSSFNTHAQGTGALGPGQACGTDNDLCASGECSNGLCTCTNYNCPSSLNCCPDGYTCDLASGFCSKNPTTNLDYGAHCESNSDCKSKVCLTKVCVCSSDNDCPTGLHCLGVYCGEGAIGAYCTKNVECLSGYCDTFLGECGCKVNGDCPQGQNCNNGFCGEGGGSDATGQNIYCYNVFNNVAEFIYKYADEDICKNMCANFDCDATTDPPCTNWCCLGRDDLNSPTCTSGSNNGGNGNVIPGGSAAIPNPLKCGDIPCVVKAIADWITGFVVVLGSIMIIISGIQFITSAGSEEKARRARQTIIYTVIGIAIAVSVDFIIGLLGEVLGRNQ